LGGTFDPPHLGHLVLAASARAALALDRVLFMPAGDPWRKADQPITPAALRLELVRAAIDGLAWAEASDIEVRRPGPTYTVDTLRELAGATPDAAWWFLLGTDAVADLPTWHEPEAILAQARLGLVSRGAMGGNEALPEATLQRFPDIAARIDRVPMPPLAVSATMLRRRIADGVATDVLLPGTVRAVIERERLYR